MLSDPDKTLRRQYTVRPEMRPTQGEIRQRQKRMLRQLSKQLTYGAPNNEDERQLQRLKQQMEAGKVRVRLFLKHPLHAKLYLLHYAGPHPRTAYLGSSNLTFSGLQGNGELNIDVRDTVATETLTQWFQDRWDDRFCVDVTADLIEIIEEGWAGEKLIPPYQIYLKMAYHLSREAQRGIDEFAIPEPFNSILFDFQKKAVQIAARHLNQRGGVLIGDVVGLGKTLMATALVKIFEEDLLLETLIICPKNLVPMWENQVAQYGLRNGKVMSISRVQNDLEQLTRFRLVVIDESHNLRNREGKRYRAIREYVERMDSRVILLSATPYNKSYLDLSSQLRLFVEPEMDLGIRPNNLINEMGILEFNRRFENIPPRSLLAFEKSEHPEDWRELMSLFMVRRTRGFIRDNYAREDERGKYLEYADGSRSHFPLRLPHRLTFTENAQYQRLYSEEVVETISDLMLPRYGLGQYVKQRHKIAPTPAEQHILDDLSRAGERLKGFSRTNLFKRLESSGYAFMLSLERHILRNYVYLHALDNGLPLPIGTQDVVVLDTQFVDEDIFGEDEEGEPLEKDDFGRYNPEVFQQRAEHIYETYANQYRRRFRWLRSDLFNRSLHKALLDDALNLITILVELGEWSAESDVQLAALAELLTQHHAKDKVLIFSQFADTVRYLAQELPKRGIAALEGVTGDHRDPTYAAWRFSPSSNQKRHAISERDELRVLIATDVLSEGQNLQDAFVVVNYDLPWAIIRLIQRAGRVDRIGQKSETIHVYSMWPAEGLEQIINLRARLRNRLRQNAEVVGADEQFFEDEEQDAGHSDALRNLYNEEAGVLDDDEERDVDLVSYAYQIWKNATEANPLLQEAIAKMADVVYSAKAATQDGVLLFLRTTLGNNALAWLDANGESVTQSQFDILNAAACSLDEPALPRLESHHELVQQGVAHVMQEQKTDSVTLGRASGARYKIYERLNNYVRQHDNTFFAESELMRNVKLAIDQLSRHRLRESTKDRLNRQLRSGITNENLARAVAAYFEENQLCLIHDETTDDEPQIICSLGLIQA